MGQPKEIIEIKPKREFWSSKESEELSDKVGTQISAKEARELTRKFHQKKEFSEEEEKKRIKAIREHNGKIWIEDNGEDILRWIREAAENGRSSLEYTRGMFDWREWREITQEIEIFLKKNGFTDFYSGQMSMGAWGFWVKW